MKIKSVKAMIKGAKPRIGNTLFKYRWLLTKPFSIQSLVEKKEVVLFAGGTLRRKMLKCARCLHSVKVETYLSATGQTVVDFAKITHSTQHRERERERERERGTDRQTDRQIEREIT